MRRFQTIRALGPAVIAVCIITMAGTRWAGSSTVTITVTADIVGSCKFNTSIPVLSVGQLGFDRSGNALGKTYTQSPDLIVTYWCTKGTIYDLQDSVGSIKNTTVTRSRKLTNGTDTIPYTLKISDAGRDQNEASSTMTNITLSAEVPPGSYSHAAPGAYTDTLTLTVTP